MAGFSRQETFVACEALFDQRNLADRVARQRAQVHRDAGGSADRKHVGDDFSLQLGGTSRVALEVKFLVRRVSIDTAHRVSQVYGALQAQPAAAVYQMLERRCGTSVLKKQRPVVTRARCPGGALRRREDPTIGSDKAISREWISSAVRSACGRIGEVVIVDLPRIRRD